MNPGARRLGVRDHDGQHGVPRRNKGQGRGPLARARLTDGAGTSVNLGAHNMSVSVGILEPSGTRI